MDSKLPLLIFDDEILIHSNFAVEKIFDRHPFLLKGVNIKELFKRATLNAFNRLTEEKEITVSVKNGDSYTAVVSKPAGMLVIRFLHPNGEIPKTIVNIKTDNNYMYEHMMTHKRAQLERVLGKLESYSDAPEIDELKALLDRLYDDSADLIYEIKSSSTPCFENFEICEVVRAVIEELRRENGTKIQLVTLIHNGYVSGDKEKLIILLKEMIAFHDNVKVDVFENGDKINISVEPFMSEKVEFSDVFTKKDSPYLWKVFANSAGCTLYSQKNPDQGIRSILVYETKKLYRTCVLDNDIYIDKRE